MTPDKTPTDAELKALLPTKQLARDEVPKVQVWLTQSDALAFARAVLAKWGSPVVAVEPVASITTAQISRMFKNLDGLDQNQSGAHHAKGWNDALRLCMDYATPQPTQAQAGAVPKYRMLEPGVDRIDAADEYLQDDAQTWEKDPGGVFVGSIYGGALRPARRVITSLIGITHKEGGQHG